MAQDDYIIANDSGAGVRTDLNSTFLAAVTLNSGSSAPGTTYADMLWADTSTTPNIIKIRNAGDTAFKALFSSDGQLRTESGSVATPGHSFSSDPNTGAFNPAGDRYVISTNGVENARFGTSEVVFNEASNDIDFRVESNGNTHMFFVDAGTNKIGINTSSPDGTVHIHTASAGAISASADANELIAENSGDAGLTILSGNSNDGNIYFGDDGGQSEGRIRYRHSSDALEFYSKSIRRMSINTDGNIGIGTNIIDTSAKLEIDSTTGALLFPRMTTVQRDALTAVNGMQIYNSTDNQMQGYINGSWAAM